MSKITLKEHNKLVITSILLTIFITILLLPNWEVVFVSVLAALFGFMSGVK